MSVTGLLPCDVRLQPLLYPKEVAPPPKASLLELERCNPQTVRPFIAAWHSRLPKTQVGPWRLAFVAHFGQTCYGAALWHNPSARGLSQEWLELRRLAIPSTAPSCTASWMLGAMRRWISEYMPQVPRLCSYQDTEVHTGTIYRAAGWEPVHISQARQRDRTPLRVGTRRGYRSDLNGQRASFVAKVRWEVSL